MRYVFRFWSTFALGVSLVAGCSEDEGISREAELINEYLDAYVEEYLSPDGPGFALAVLGPDNEIVLQRAYGMANRDVGLPIGFNTPFELASVSKMFTATAILILYEDGSLDLSDPISQFFPEAPASWEKITVQHLLTHQSGLPLAGVVLAGVTNEELLDLLMDRPLVAEPGSVYEYNNGGYVLLALIVERLSDQPFKDFVAKRIFEPLGMENTQIVDRFPPDVSGAALSQVDPSAPQDFPIQVVGPGGQYSSIEDLMRWEAELRNVTLISPESLQLAQTPYVGTEGSCGYGYAWQLCEYEGWPADMYHTGLRNGFQSMLYRAPSEGLAVMMVSNGSLEHANRALGFNVAYLYLEGEVWAELDAPCPDEFCDFR